MCQIIFNFPSHAAQHNYLGRMMTTVKNAAQQSVVKTMGNLHWTETLDQHQMSFSLRCRQYCFYLLHSVNFSRLHQSTPSLRSLQFQCSAGGKSNQKDFGCTMHCRQIMTQTQPTS